MSMRATALALFVALLFPTAAVMLASPADPACCCTSKGGKTCPMKRRAQTCDMSREGICGIQQRSDHGTAVLPLIGDRQPAVLAEAIHSAFHRTSRSLVARDVFLVTRFLFPPEPPPPKRA